MLFYDEEGGRRLKADPEGPESTAFTPWGLDQYRINLALIARLSRMIGADLFICKQAHAATPDGTAAAQATARDYGRRMLDMPHETIMQGFRHSYAVIDQNAAERGASVIDMNAMLSGLSDYFADGIHFSAAGSKAAAKLTAEALLPVVKRRAASPAAP